MKAGPKGQVTAPPLDLRRLPKRGGSRAIAFVERYVRTPKGTGARLRMRYGRGSAPSCMASWMSRGRGRDSSPSPPGTARAPWPRRWGCSGCWPMASRAPGCSSSPATSGRPASSCGRRSGWSSSTTSWPPACRPSPTTCSNRVPTRCSWRCPRIRAPCRDGTRRLPSWMSCTWSPTTRSRRWRRGPASATGRCCWPSRPRPGSAMMA
jgi:hypothetical protein